MKPTVVFGASTKPERYSYKAIHSLLQHGHQVYAQSIAAGELQGITFDTAPVAYANIHTVSLYVGPQNQPQYYDYIESLNPRRVIFNPGTENPEFEQRLQAKGIEATEACTLVLLATGQF